MCDVSRGSVSNSAERTEEPVPGPTRPAGRRFKRFDLPLQQRECTLMTQTSSSAPSAKPAARTSELSPGTAERLSTDDGKISVAQSVVQKIAGIACREISGVHA